jgi:uncharacterized protein
MSAEIQNLFTLTWRGNKFYPGNPAASEFNMADIAHHLAQENRYGGAANFPYSVAQHSCLMAEKMLAATNNVELALDCLFHDATEAYIKDMLKPIKLMLPDYNKLETRVDRALRDWLRANGIAVPIEQTPECKNYDKRMFLTEWPVLKGHGDAGQWYPDHEPFDDVLIEEWDWKTARQNFYGTARELSKSSWTENTNG